MSNLDKTQLTELTERVTARLGEWGRMAQYMPDVSAGLVRLVVDEYHDWQVEQEREHTVHGPTGAAIARVGIMRLPGQSIGAFEHNGEPVAFRITLDDDESNADRYYRGFNDGYEHAKEEFAPVPVPDDDQGDPPPATVIMPLELHRAGYLFYACEGGWTIRHIPLRFETAKHAEPAGCVPEALAHFETRGNGFYVGADGTEQTPWESLEQAADNLTPGVAQAVSDAAKAIGSALEPDAPPPADATEKPAAPKGFPLPPAPDDAPPQSDKKSPDQTATSDKKSFPPAPAVPRLHTHEAKPDVAAINKPRTLAEANRSESRQRQLDSLKAKRRADADRKDREARARAAADVSRAQLVAEVKRISMGGHMPTQTAFNMSKPATWPTANALVMKFHTSWEAIAEECGLEWSRGRKNVPSAA